MFNFGVNQLGAEPNGDNTAKYNDLGAKGKTIDNTNVAHSVNQNERSEERDHLEERMMSPEEKNQYRLKKAVGLSGLG